MSRVALVLPVLLAACGPSPAASTEWLPLTLGSRWVYQQVQDRSETMTEEVSAEEVLGDEPGVLMLSTRNDRLVRTYSKWLAGPGRIAQTSRQLWERETLIGSISYGPDSLQFSRALTRLGDAVTEAHHQRELDGDGRLIRERRKEYTWLAEAVDEEVTVPAGVFRCLRIKRIDHSDQETRVTWYAPGVGKIREQTATGELVLTGYSVASHP
jgi:hypothetical protein